MLNAWCFGVTATVLYCFLSQFIVPKAEAFSTNYLLKIVFHANNIPISPFGVHKSSDGQTIYVIGGYDGSHSLRNVWLIDGFASPDQQIFRAAAADVTPAGLNMHSPERIDFIKNRVEHRTLIGRRIIPFPTGISLTTLLYPTEKLRWWQSIAVQRLSLFAARSTLSNAEVNNAFATIAQSLSLLPLCFIAAALGAALADRYQMSARRAVVMSIGLSAIYLFGFVETTAALKTHPSLFVAFVPDVLSIVATGMLLIQTKREKALVSK